MTRLARQFTLFYLGFGVAALPLLFVYYDHYPASSLTLRMLIIAKYQIFAIILFAAQDTRSRLVASIGWHTWILIAVLVAIALSKLAFDVGNKTLTINRTLMWLLHLFFAFGAIATLRKLSAQQILVFIMSTIGISILMYIVIVLAIEVGNTEVDIRTCTISFPGFGNVRYTGYFASFAYMFFLSISSQKNLSGLLRFFCLLSAVIVLFFILYTGTRGAIAASAVAVLISAVLLGRQWYRLIIAATFTTILAIIAIGLITPHACPSFNAIARIFATLDTDVANISTGQTNAVAKISATLDTDVADMSTGTTNAVAQISAALDMDVANISTGRTAVWATSFELFKERPLFGHGEIKLRKVTDLWVTQAHNSVLQSLMTWGVVGAACFWALIMILAWNILRVSKTAPLVYLPYTSALSCMLAYSMIDATLYYSYPLLLTTFAIVGIFATATTLSPDKGDGTNSQRRSGT